MREERLLPILGLALAVLLIALAAFAVGVVVGRHGRLAWNPEAALGRGIPGGAPPGAPPQGARPDGKGGPGSSGAPPAGGAQPRPQVVGRIQQRTAQSLTLATRRGPRTVTLTPKTQYRTQDGAPLTLTDLREGDIVAVWGAFTLPGQTLQATLVVRLQGER